MSAARRRRPCWRLSCSSIRSRSISTSASRMSCVSARRWRERGATREDVMKYRGRGRAAGRDRLSARRAHRLRRAEHQHDHRHAGGPRHSAESEARAAARLFRARSRPAAGRGGRAARSRRRAGQRPGRPLSSWCVNKDNVVEQRKVEIGPLVGTHAGDRQGADRRTTAWWSRALLRAIPGQKVDPQSAPEQTAAR